MQHTVMGKQGHLNRLWGEERVLRALAIDHRIVYQNILAGYMGREPSAEEIVQSKIDVIQSLSAYFSAVLADPLYGGRRLRESGSLRADQGLLLSIEGNDYSTQTFADDYLMEGVTPESIAQAGGDCVKLFLYYNPDSPLKEVQLKMIGEVAEQCSKTEIPFLLEPILFEWGQPYIQEERAELMLRTVREMNGFEIDILKLEFPGSLTSWEDAENAEICRTVTREAEMPWILLSQGVDAKQLKQQIAFTAAGGAQGFAIGRTVWQDYLVSGQKDKRRRLEEMIHLFEECSNIALKRGQ